MEFFSFAAPSAQHESELHKRTRARDKVEDQHTRKKSTTRPLDGPYPSIFDHGLLAATQFVSGPLGLATTRDVEKYVTKDELSKNITDLKRDDEKREAALKSARDEATQQIHALRAEHVWREQALQRAHEESKDEINTLRLGNAGHEQTIEGVQKSIVMATQSLEKLLHESLQHQQNLQHLHTLFLQNTGEIGIQAHKLNYLEALYSDHELRLNACDECKRHLDALAFQVVQGRNDTEKQYKALQAEINQHKTDLKADQEALKKVWEQHKGEMDFRFEQEEKRFDEYRKEAVAQLERIQTGERKRREEDKIISDRKFLSELAKEHEELLTKVMELKEDFTGRLQKQEEDFQNKLASEKAQLLLEIQHLKQQNNEHKITSQEKTRRNNDDLGLLEGIGKMSLSVRNKSSPSSWHGQSRTRGER